MGSKSTAGKSCTKYRCVLITAGIVAVGLIVSYKCPPASSPIISIENGKIQGVVSYSRNGTEYYSFFGIPYGIPAKGKLRFEPSIPFPSWEGVLQTIKFRPICKQFDAMILHNIVGSEDCLFVNVFSPIQLNKTTRPVLVYIPGGGFMSGGSAHYHPDYLMDHDILLITFNYRLGPFGFLNLESENGDGSLPRGNMAFKDQLLLLKWVQRNAMYFGGDINRVTLMGQSAGAASVNFHILAPQSHGLFQRAINQSGSAFCPWAFSTKWKEISTKFVQNLGCPIDDKEKLPTCLQSYDADEIFKYQVTMLDPRVEKDLLVASVESIKTDDAFLTESPNELARKGSIAKVPLLVGVNGGEGAFRVSRFAAIPEDLIPQYESNWSELVGKFIGFDNFPKNLSTVVRNHYFGNLSFTKDPTTFKQIIAKIGSDAAMYEQVDRTIMFHARSGSPTYAYYFNYRPTAMVGFYSAYRAIPPNDWMSPNLRVMITAAIDFVKESILRSDAGSHEYGIAHGDDLFMLWNIDGQSRPFTYWETDFSISHVQMIIDFVYDVQPFSYRGTKWSPVNVSAVDNGEKVQYMLMDNSKGNGKMIPEPFAEGIQFWRELGIENFN